MHWILRSVVVSGNEGTGKRTPPLPFEATRRTDQEGGGTRWNWDEQFFLKREGLYSLHLDEHVEP